MSFYVRPKKGFLIRGTALLESAGWLCFASLIAYLGAALAAHVHDKAELEELVRGEVRNVAPRPFVIDANGTMALNEIRLLRWTEDTAARVGRKLAARFSGRATGASACYVIVPVSETTGASRGAPRPACFRVGTLSVRDDVILRTARRWSSGEPSPAAISIGPFRYQSTAVVLALAVQVERTADRDSFLASVGVTNIVEAEEAVLPPGDVGL